MSAEKQKRIPVKVEAAAREWILAAIDNQRAETDSRPYEQRAREARQAKREAWDKLMEAVDQVAQEKSQ